MDERRAASGYLERAQRPESRALLPAPPAAGSPAQAAHLAVYRATPALQGTPRRAQAAVDDKLKLPKAAEAFSCALDRPISQQATPHFNMRLRRSLLDASLSTYAAKEHYERQRPFAARNDDSCMPTTPSRTRPRRPPTRSARPAPGG